MKKIYFLSTCDTCRRLMKEWDLPEEIDRIDIKKEALNEKELEHLYSLAGSYEALFNKRSRKLREKGLKADQLSEDDYKALLLEHYSFLKRPVILFEDKLFVGNAKSTSESVKAFFNT